MPSNNQLTITLTANDGSNQIYISPDTSLNVMTLTLKNTSPSDTITLNAYSNNSPYTLSTLPATQSGVFLLFNGMLPNAVVDGITCTSADWTLQRITDDTQNGHYLVLLPRYSAAINSADSLSLTLQFPAVTGSANSGYFSCEAAHVSIGLNTLDVQQQLYVSLVYPLRTDGSAKAVPPLEFSTVGTNVVYTGTSYGVEGAANELTFRITNTSTQGLIPTGGYSSVPKLNLYFIQGSGSGTLMNNTEAAHTSVNLLNSYGNYLQVVPYTNDVPSHWNIIETSSNNGTFIGTGASASITLKATNIKTAAPAGTISMAVLEYSGFPGYEDGQLTTEIIVSAPAPQPLPDPEIVLFSPDRYSINIADAPLYDIIISYQVRNATSLSIYKNTQRIVYSDQNTITNNQTLQTRWKVTGATTFYISVSNADGKTVTQTFIVDVDYVPVGTIIAWTGPQSTIPAGWAVCDGSFNIMLGSTSVQIPNLRERFILGASSDSYTSPNTHYLTQRGGGAPHNHSFSTTATTITSGSENSHDHTIEWANSTKFKTDSSGTQVYYSKNSSTTTDTTDPHAHSVTIPQLNGWTSAATPDLPPYWALYYIIKVN